MDILKFLLVFLEGVISFFSPCVLPILPVYISILASSGESENKSNPLVRNTIMFVIGISTTFLILGSSINALSKFFLVNKDILTFIGGILIIIMGLFYMNILKIPFLQREKRLDMKTDNMSPITAYILGFTFSFGWTPCIGPMLASVLVMAASSESVLSGNLLLVLYTLGFIIPFLILSIFYNRLSKTLIKIKNHMNLIKKVGGIILLISGAVMIFNSYGRAIKHFDFNTPKTEVTQKQGQEETSKEETPSESETEENQTEEVMAPDFKLVDQYGKSHTLSEYKGKTVFLNFWATWCPPCKEEMPDIEKIYNEYGKNKEDVIILGVAAPDLGREKSKEGITEFLKEKGYTYPTVFDETEDKDVFYTYYINSFPTTFIIDKNGNVAESHIGMLDYNQIKTIIDRVK